MTEVNSQLCGYMYNENNTNASVFNLFNARGVGIDIVRVERFQEKVSNEHFLERIFSRYELTDAGKGPHLSSRLAGRWAAKEATAKALGCGLGSQLGWREIEVVKNGDGQPRIKLAPEAAERHDFPKLELSISHDGEYAIAIVVLVGKDPYNSHDKAEKQN